METETIANRKILRGARKVTLWDTRTLSETTVFYGYQTPEVKPKKVVKGVISLSMWLRLREKKPEISIYEVNETRKGINALFKPDIPEINKITLIPATKKVKDTNKTIKGSFGLDVNTFKIKTVKPYEIKIRFGDCVKQRSQYPYRIRAKNRIRRIKKRESPPLTLKRLKFNPKFIYTVSFKCPLCNSHQTMRIKDKHRKRKTPICKKHKQPMYIAKVTKKRPKNSEKLAIPKIIYGVHQK